MNAELAADLIDPVVTETVAHLRTRLAAAPQALPHTPRLAVLLGSGWGPFADLVQGAVDVPYTELPAFPRLAIGGHAGLLRAGTLADVPVLVLAGRKHAYETGEPDGMKGAIRSLAALGVQVLVQTNAAGSLDSAMHPGSLMLVADHLNMVQHSPLLRESDNRRFVDMNHAYDPALRALAGLAANHLGLMLFEGIYACVLGPQFETPAEIRMLRTLGAQAVGMSTVPETIIARHAGLRVLALSLITNMAAGLSDEQLSHDHTLANARSAGVQAVALLGAVVAALGAELDAGASRLPQA